MSESPTRLRRKSVIRSSQQAINGIDYVEVLSLESSPPGVGTVLVALLKSQGASTLGTDQVKIQGGVRITAVAVVWAYTAQSLLLGLPDGWTSAEQAELASWVARRPGFDPAAVLVVRTNNRGDLSTYQLILSSSEGCQIDGLLATGTFTFYVDEPAEFDPAPTVPGVTLPPTDLPLDYTARDFEAVRRLMLDRMAVTLPQWTERNPADIGVTLVEVLAHAVDALSYYQDAVATEAYLDTARTRTSVRRHARLLDYNVSDGRSARVWVQVQVGPSLDGQPFQPPAGVVVQVHTRVESLPVVLDDGGLLPPLPEGTRVFEPLDRPELWVAHNQISLYAWGEESYILPAGSTSATLLDPDRALQLAVGDTLLLEIVASPTGILPPEGASRAHVVRITAVTRGEDPLFSWVDGAEVPYTGPAPNPDPLRWLEVGWAEADRLPFDLPLGTGRSPDGQVSALSVARGNLVLLDHGRSGLEGEVLAPWWPGRRGRPTLKLGPLTRQSHVRDQNGHLSLVDGRAPAASLGEAPPQVRPAIWLEEVLTSGQIQVWSPQPDLLSSGPFSADFVVEEESDGRARLRFGDDQFGRSPSPCSTLTAYYRVGTGTAGNVGAASLAHVRLLRRPGVVSDLSPWLTGILRVSNPLPASGGEDPEPLQQVRLQAPQAFRKQRRAVTEQDYAEVASSYPEVQKVVATFRWTGSWYTVFLSVDRLGDRPVDDTFKRGLLQYLEPFRMAGHDLEILSPLYVALDIGLSVRVADGFVRANVRQQLLEEFSAADLPGGRRGLFHPDNFTFGQPVYLSRRVVVAMAVPGVAWVSLDEGTCRFQRWGQPARGEVAAGVISLGELEVARLDNDPTRPERGRLELWLEGGL